MTGETTVVQAALPEQGGPGRSGPDEAHLAERPGPCLPGWIAAGVLSAAVLAAGWLLCRAGAAPVRPPGLPVPADPSRGAGLWTGVALLAAVAAFAAGGLARGRPGSVWLLTRHGGYQGTVRRTGLLWISPLLKRRRMDVSLRHWRSRPIDAVDAHGTPLRVSVLLVWRVRETAKAAFAVDDYRRLLREQVEAAVARAVSRHPADDFQGGTVTLRDCDRLGDELGRLLAAQMRPVGVEVFSATPVRVDYAPEVAAVMGRARVASLEARQRRAVLDDVLLTVGETLRGIAERGLVQLDDYERKSLVRDLTVALLARPPGQ